MSFSSYTTRIVFALLLLPFVLLAANPPKVGEVPEEVRRRLKLSLFYQKYVTVGELPVVSSTNVSDVALQEAAYLVEQMLSHRPEILTVMASNGVRFAVMAYNEFTTDIPEHSHLKPQVFWDRRARGLGATRTAPAVSCGEENLLCFPGDPYSTENLLIHEFAHAVHEMGMESLENTFDPRLHTAYEAAMSKDLWKGTYAAVNHSEYWAEAVQCWFDNNRANDALHNHVDTRAELKSYDPAVAKLCAEVFGDGKWRYRKPSDRPESERPHFAHYNAAQAPKFVWREAPYDDAPRVLIQTAVGDIEVELDAKRAPVTVKNFLRYVHEGYYSDGSFHRTVTPSNQPDNPVKIEVIQAAANPAKRAEFPSPIAMERTRDTGLKHVDGTLTMARDEPDTAQDEFVICLGDQPALDFGGKRNPDGQGFAAFGQVVKGMEIARKIQASTAEAQKLTPPIRIQRAIRVH